MNDEKLDELRNRYDGQIIKAIRELSEGMGISVEEAESIISAMLNTTEFLKNLFNEMQEELERIERLDINILAKEFSKWEQSFKYRVYEILDQYRRLVLLRRIYNPP